MRRFPPGRHFAVTWSIPDSYGGMTSALLQRSRAFARVAGVPVDILTFEARDDHPQLVARMRQTEELGDGVDLLNLYDWLASHPLPGGSLRLDRDLFTPLTGDARTRTAADGTVLQIDHRRADGTLLLVDRRDTRERGVPGGRSIVLCDAAGRPVRSWQRIHHLYAAWLDQLTAGQPSWMIVDSKSIAPFMLGYRRRHVRRLHVVHNSHLAAGGVRASRRAVFEDLGGFDALVLLTDRQRRDVRASLGADGRLVVIPNPVDLPAPTASVPRGDGGVVLASLTPRKRVDQAMTAAASAGATLDVSGAGELRDELEAMASALPGIRLHGHRADARDRLNSASFLVATGRSEGFPLVLLESMAAGCIPIAYDVPYGPSDLIDGVNGVLVPSGDVSALAAAIRGVAAESPARLARRRARARSTARRFSDEAITAMWSREFRVLERGRRPTRVVRLRRAASRWLSRPDGLGSLLPSPR